MNKYFFLLIFLTNTALAEDNLPPPAFSDPTLSIAIIQNQFTFDSSTVESATVITGNDGIFVGLEIKLKPAAAEQFSQMVKSSLGKTANFVFNNKVISTATLQTELGRDIILRGISQIDAVQFVAILKKNQTPRALPYQGN